MKRLRNLSFARLACRCHRLVLALWLGCLGLALAGQGAGTRRILVLTSYGAGRPGVAALVQGFRAALDRGGLGVEQIFTENLDLERAQGAAFRRSLARTLNLKYAGRPLDLVYVLEQPALDFTLANLAALTRGVPVILVRADLPGAAADSGQRYVRQLISFDVEGTLHRALELFPNTRQVLFVAGSTESDRAFLARTERLMEPWRGRVAWADTSSLTYEQTLARILDPGPGTVILVLPFNRDAAGRTLVQMEVAFQVAARAGAPVFTLWDLPVGRGAVGGNVTNFTEVGQQAGEFALGLLGGGRVLTAPVTDLPARSTPLFDWQQIERWHGDPGDLPRASVFVNRPDTLWVHYRREVIWTALFLLTQTVLIAMLLVQLRLRNLAQSRLRESEARFRLLFERAPLGMSIVDSGSGRFLAVNPRMGEIVGYDPAELERTTFQSITHPDHLAADLDSVESLAAGAVPEIGMEKRYLHRSGRVVWVRLRMVRLPCVPGQPLRHMALVEDITEARRAQEALRESETQLMQAQKMESLGVLAAGVAHNINNVLSVIMGTASVRERAAAPGEDREAYRIIGAACLRGRDVVKALVHFAQPALAVHAPFELQALIGEVCGLLAGTARKNIRIVPEPAAAPLWINGDSGSINHVLLNLCINAMDAMPDGGDLRIRTALRDGPWAEVTVEDTGAGMSADVLAHALEPFYTTKEIGKGTGLGLSMSYGVVKAHGGAIDIASQPGQGTAVRLRFPAVPRPAPSAPAPAEAPDLAAWSIYLVDDDEDVRFLMVRMLRKAGVGQVRTFPGGEAVLAALQAEPGPDLVILDQNMPGLTGTQTLVRITALRPDLPVLISSGQPDIEDWACLRRPGVAVISKPFNLEEIQAKLGEFARAPVPFRPPAGPPIAGTAPALPSAPDSCLPG